MGRIGRVIAVENNTSDGDNVRDVKIDIGGGQNLLAPLLQSSGVDAPPLPDDYVATVTHPGDNNETTAAFVDPSSDLKSENGEFRAFGRDTTKTQKNEVHLKGDGTISINNHLGTLEILPTGMIVLNGQVNAALKGTIFITNLTTFLTAVVTATSVVGTSAQNATALTAIGVAANALLAQLQSTLSTTVWLD